MSIAIMVGPDSALSLVSGLVEPRQSKQKQLVALSRQCCVFYIFRPAKLHIILLIKSDK